MDTQNNNTKSTPNESTSKIDEALNDIRKAISSENNARDDILELTEIIEDNDRENSKSTLQKDPPQATNLSQPIPSRSSEDILKKIDNNIAAKKLQTSPPKSTREVNMENNLDATSLKEKLSTADNEVQNSDNTGKSYIAEEVAKKSQDLFRSFIKATSKNHTNNIQFRSGITLEDLVIELLRPELSNWMNKNLPDIVQSVVEKEVKKLIPQDE